METGVLGVPCQLALSLVEVALNLILDSATIQHRLMEELLVLVKAQKLLLAMHSNAQLVKQTIYNKQLLYLLYYLD
jgi:hypothetical protein